MHNRNLFLAALIVVPALIVLLNCENPSTKPETLPDGATRHGFYVVMTPYAGGAINTDSTVVITWTWTTNITDPNVKISLYKDDTLFRLCSSSTANDGSQSFTFATVTPGNYYRIKISGIIDTSKYDFGGYFTVKNQYFGTITITSPVDTTTARVGYSIPVRWTTTDSIGSTINIQLYKDTVTVGSSYSATTSLHLYSYPLSSSLVAGPKYRFKAWSYYNASIYDFSDYFTITSRYIGTITVTSPADTTKALIGSSVPVRWTTTDSVGATVSIRLYNDTTAAGSTYTASTSNGSYTYSLPSSLVPGSKYRIKVMSYYDENIYGYSPYFTVTSQYNGGYTITSPDSGATWAAGSSYYIQWSTAGSPGSYVRITLFKGGDSVSLITSSYSNNESYPWTIPPGTITSSDYRIRVSSYYDPTIYALSDVFTISGAQADQYEDDNTRAKASTITPGTTQNHTLTSGDTDFVAMNLDSGKIYNFSTRGTAYTYNYLYSSTDSVYSLASYSAYGGTGSQRWTCTRSAKYYMRITLYSSSYTGPYTFSLAEFDSLSSAKFITPDSTTTWAAGSSYSVTWTPDTALFGTLVYLYLWDEPHRSLLSSTSSTNGGTCTFSIPSGLNTGRLYRMKMVNYDNSAIYGYSPKFTVSGIAPDGFEPDNNRASASTLVPGTVQNHTLSYRDTDFVAMNLDSGKIYLIGNTGTAYSYNYIYSSTDSLSYLTSFSTYSSGTGSLRWVCPRSGKYYDRITQYSTSYTGAYALTVTQFDSMTAARFISPDSNTTWAAGSSYSVTWTPDTALFGTTVYLYLWDESHRTLISSTSSTNGGSCSFSILSGLTTGKVYRIKMVNYYSTTICGYSKLFTITGIAPDGFEPDNKRAEASTLILGSPQSHTITRGDTDFVAMNLDSGRTYSFSTTGTGYTYNYLYSSTDSLSYITSYSSTGGTTGSLRWNCPRTGKYYNRIIPYSVSYLGPYTFNAMAYDSVGAAKFIAPDSTTTWATGSAYNVTWTPDSAFFGTTVYLYLWDEKRRTLVSSTSSTNGGTCSFSVPAGLESGKFYRMKMVNYSVSANYGYSQLFYISGIAPDAFEPDDSASMAKTIPADSTVQVRSLCRNDVDWVTFSSIAPLLYVINVACSTSTSVRFFASGSNLVTPTQTASGSLSSNARMSWFCSAASTSYFSVQGASTTNAGNYRAWVKAYDSSAYRFTVPSPAAGASVKNGSILAITWSARVSLGGTVDIFLYDNANTPQTIIADQSNTGSYSWTVPSTVVSGSGYYVKVALHSSSEVFGTSGTFSIVP
jgi:hypothetical protein